MYPSKSYILLGFIQKYYAPDSKAQEKITGIYNQMFMDGLTESEVSRNLIRILHDGVEHGNWPWAVMNVNIDRN
jgi:hypothetical protein